MGTSVSTLKTLDSQHGAASSLTRGSVGWGRATAALGVVLAMLFVQWQVIDKAPPQWDQSSYLLEALNEFNAAKSGGFPEFYSAFLTTNPGQVGLLALLAQPGFWIIGTYPDAAILPFALLWLLAVWGLYDLTSQLGQYVFKLSNGAAAAGGFFSALLFAIYPMTQFTSNTFLTEFPLITSVILVHATALRYFLTGRLRWPLAGGFAIAFGLLAKITFPAFLLVPAVLVIVRWFTATRREVACALILFVGPALVIAAPFFVRNIDSIVARTNYLTSAKLAQAYGAGGAWDLWRSLHFIAALLQRYEFVLLALLALFTICFYTAGLWSRAVWFILLFLGFLVPFTIVTFSNFKGERYAYPAYPPLFVLAGLGLSTLWRGPRSIAAAGTALLLFVPGLKAGMTYNVIPPEALSLLKGGQSTFWTNAFDAPKLVDTKDWQATELVRFVDQHAGPGSVVLLGGSPAFQGPLLRLLDKLQGGDRFYTSFPVDAFPNSTVDDLLTFVKKASPTAILYKTPPYVPTWLGLHAKETFDTLVQSGAYRSSNLPVKQPDGSRFILLVSKGPVEVLARRSQPSKLAHKEEALYSIGGRYEASNVTFEDKDDAIVATLQLRRTGEPLPGETMLFHLLDESGTIVAQLDRKLCADCDAPADVESWIERFTISRELAQRVYSIGFGIWDPARPQLDPLEVTGGSTDWGGHRALVKLPH